MNKCSRSPFLALALVWCTFVMASGASRAQTLGDALNAPALDWSSGGTVPWSVESDLAQDGVAAVMSGAITNGNSTIQTSLAGPATIGFWWKVSCAPVGANLSFAINGDTAASLSGNVDWQYHNFHVSGSGPQTVSWTYTQGAASNSYQNRAWLDLISFPIPSAPSISLDLTNRTIPAGSTLNLNGGAAGTEPFTYQWYFNGNAISGSIQSSLVISDVQSANSGSYHLVITGPFGAATSSVAAITVAPSAPTFTVQPLSQRPSQGLNIVLNATAIGTEPLAWQWYSNGVAIAGANLSSLIIGGIQGGQYADYRVVAANSVGSTSSAVATLSYPQVVAWGGTMYGQTKIPFAATNVIALTAGDQDVLALRRDGTLVSWGQDEAGGLKVPAYATNIAAIGMGSSHTLALRRDGVVLQWGLVLFTAIGNAPPSATNIAALAQGPGAQHALALSAGGVPLEWAQTNATFQHYAATNSPPPEATNIVAISSGALHCLALRADGVIIPWGDYLNYQTNIPAAASNVVAIASGWYHNLALRADGTLVQWGNTPGFSLSHPGNVVSMACGGNNSLVLLDDGVLLAYGDNTYGQSTVPSWAGTNLSAVAGGSYASFALRAEGPPALTSALVNRSITAGKTAYFRATATGAWPLSYQWQFNSTNLPGATNLTLAISNAQLAQAGPYAVVVSNSLGVATSPPSILTVVSDQAGFYLASLSNTNRTFNLGASGPVGLAWTLQSSSNLLNWTDLKTATNSLGNMTFSLLASNSVNRYYRLKLIQ